MHCIMALVSHADSHIMMEAMSSQNLAATKFMFTCQECHVVSCAGIHRAWWSCLGLSKGRAQTICSGVARVQAGAYV